MKRDNLYYYNVNEETSEEICLETPTNCFDEILDWAIGEIFNLPRRIEDSFLCFIYLYLKRIYEKLMHMFRRKIYISRRYADGMIDEQIAKLYSSLAEAGYSFEQTPGRDGDEETKKIFEKKLRKKYRIIE